MSAHNRIALKNLLDRFNFINIFGEAGTGKTTFALQLVNNLLSYPEPGDISSVWIQASESFPSKRLKTLFSNDQFLLNHLLHHIFIIPKKPTSDYYQLNSLLANLTTFQRGVPPNTRVLVIDNISHHLRYELSQFSDIGDKVAILDDFFDSVIVPLTFFCEESRITFILIHEVSYDPDQDKTVMFNHQLFERINSLDIELKKDLFSRRHYIHFHTEYSSKSFEYTLRQKGISIQI
ncbi:MAG: AAA family ATPase [Candidatus Lokiarchaeota archaeon]|nr:AAA family ATPase [Candidatus Lokiarchaeota archaeon]